MERQELFQAIKKGDADREFLMEIEEALDKELSKPVSEQDFDLIDDLTQTISLMEQTDALIARRTRAGIAQLEYQLTRKPVRKWKKSVVAAGLCAAVIGLSCIWSASAFGLKNLPSVYQISGGSIQIDMTAPFDAEIKAENIYADEMRSICDEQGFRPLIPSYIPDGFEPTDLYGTAQYYETYRTVRFDFKCKDSKLTLIYWDYEHAEDLPKMGIPSDTYNFTQEVFNGTVVHVVKENNQYTAVFLIGQTQYLLFTDGLDYDESRHVLESMFP